MIDALKLRELERRIKSLELKSGQTDFNYVRYEASGEAGNLKPLLTVFKRSKNAF